jgi:hypothetical protein
MEKTPMRRKKPKRSFFDTPEDLLQQDWAGDCYGAANAWVTTVKERDWFLVHGSVLSVIAGKRIDHAWCERGEVVVDLAMPDEIRIIQREQYYRVLQPQISQRYSAEDAIVLSQRNGHEGPWEESEQLPK